MKIILNSDDVLKLVKQKYPTAKSIKFNSDTEEFEIEFDEMPNLIQPRQQPVIQEPKIEETPEDKHERERRQGVMASGGEARTMMRF